MVFIPLCLPRVSVGIHFRCVASRSTRRLAFPPTSTPRRKPRRTWPGWPRRLRTRIRISMRCQARYQSHPPRLGKRLPQAQTRTGPGPRQRLARAGVKDLLVIPRISAEKRERFGGPRGGGKRVKRHTMSPTLSCISVCCFCLRKCSCVCVNVCVCECRCECVYVTATPIFFGHHKHT